MIHTVSKKKRDTSVRAVVCTEGEQRGALPGGLIVEKRTLKCSSGVKTDKSDLSEAKTIIRATSGVPKLTKVPC